jgi:hypothetical protein
MTERVARRDSKDLIVEAAGALARLDADRLEELAEWCKSGSPGGVSDELTRLASAGAASEDLRYQMAVFDRVLEATRVNLNVLRRAGEIRSSLIESGSGTERNLTVAESGYGDD